jgi:hypothetical protein
MRDVRYRRVYSATVQLDHLDGHFDILPDDEAMRGHGLSRVPVLVGDVGATVQANAGTRCLFGFANGDPRRPRIRAWEYEAQSGRIVFDDGAAGLARQGDYVRCLVGNPAPVAGLMGGTAFVPAPPGQPIPTPVPMTPFIGTVTGILPDTVHGEILGGARRVLG